MPKIPQIPVETFAELPTKEHRDCNSCGEEAICGWWETDEDREEGHGLSWRCEECYSREIEVCSKCGGSGLIIVNTSTGQLQSLCTCHGGK